MEKNRGSGKERKQDPELFRNGGWTLERVRFALGVDGRYVSIVRADYGHQGRASEFSVNTILWD